MDLEADISGHQRKVVHSAVRPARSAHGESGIPIRSGRTLPFTVVRLWNAPAGHYFETWYLVTLDTREVVVEGPRRYIRIWGLQSATELTDLLDRPIGLQPGRYAIVFALGGLKGGELVVDAADVSEEAA